MHTCDLFLDRLRGSMEENGVRAGEGQDAQSYPNRRRHLFSFPHPGTVRVPDCTLLAKSTESKRPRVPSSKPARLQDGGAQSA